MSELMSLVLFLGFHRRLCLGKPVVTPGGLWPPPVVLGIFIVLNITLYASDYFTGDGINDAVLYTLTNSLTGAGVGKYILPGLGLVVALGGHLRRAGLGFCAVAVTVRIIMATACWRCASALASVDASPAFHQITELVKSQSRDGDPDFAAYYKEPSKKIDNPRLNLGLYLRRKSGAHLF